MHQLANRNDCFIERRDCAELRDDEGTLLYRFPLDMTDDNIWIALNFANRAYDKGYQSGDHIRAHQIRIALGMHP